MIAHTSLIQLYTEYKTASNLEKQPTSIYVFFVLAVSWRTHTQKLALSVSLYFLFRSLPTGVPIYFKSSKTLQAGQNSTQVSDAWSTLLLSLSSVDP